MCPLAPTFLFASLRLQAVLLTGQITIGLVNILVLTVIALQVLIRMAIPIHLACLSLVSGTVDPYEGQHKRRPTLGRNEKTLLRHLLQVSQERCQEKIPTGCLNHPNLGNSTITTDLYEIIREFVLFFSPRLQSNDARRSPPSDRYYDRRNRGNIELSPERNTRNDRPPAFIPGGDRYRPSASNSNKRDSFSLGRSDYDSYRPQYGNWTPPFRRDSVNSVNSTGSNFRRDSDSVHARSSDRYDSPFTSRAVSRKPSPSTRPIKSPAIPSRKTSVDTENDSWSFHPPPPRSEVPTRAPSRSSIASTHVSDRRSPVVPPVTAPPVVSRTNSSVSDLAKNLPVEKSSADGTANAIVEAKVAKNGSLGHTGKESSVTEESVPKSVSTITKQPATILPTISNDVHAASPNLSETSVTIYPITLS